MIKSIISSYLVGKNIMKFAKEIGFTIARKKQNLNKLLSRYKNY